MVSIFKLTIYLLWLMTAFWQLLLWTYWLQVKEYRYDRLLSFLKTREGRSKIYILLIILKIILLLIAVVNINYIFIAPVTLLMLNIWIIRNYLLLGLRRPQLTKRMVIILVITGFAFLIPLLFPLSLGIIVAELTLPVLLIAGTSITSYLVNLEKAKEGKLAVARLKKVSPYVIGVTGSYGKTTTKDFITHLLSQKFKTQKSIENENTFFGVVRMLKKLQEDIKYLIVEIGAYKRGEIRELTNILKPKMSVITGIEPQHLDLFGSMENLKKAKFEIVEGLGNDGIAIFNLGNFGSLELYERSIRSFPGVSSIGYVVSKKPIKTSDTLKGCKIVSYIRSTTIDRVDFDVYEIDTKLRRKFSLATSGSHFVENLTSAILVARILGLNWIEIESGIKSLKLPKNTMSVKKTNSGSYIIDDTYNATPKSFIAALDYLSLFKDKKKIVVTGGIIELGSMAKKIHFGIGKKLLADADLVLFTNKENAKYTLMGMNNSKILSYEGNQKELLNKIIKYVAEGDVILFEGKQQISVSKYIESI